MQNIHPYSQSPPPSQHTFATPITNTKRHQGSSIHFEINLTASCGVRLFDESCDFFGIDGGGGKDLLNWVHVIVILSGGGAGGAFLWSLGSAEG